MSQLIDRSERVHVNVKNQDSWKLKQDSQGSEEAMIELVLNHHQGRRMPGKVLLKGISVAKLEELQTAIGQFLETHKPRVEEMRRDMELSGEEWEAKLRASLERLNP
jgi:hypothetical protein